MSKINDGGSAFPLSFNTTDGEPSNHRGTNAGMSLRAWFAGQAMAGMMSHPDNVTGLGALAKPNGVRHSEVAAMIATDCADALIAELEKS